MRSKKFEAVPFDDDRTQEDDIPMLKRGRLGRTFKQNLIEFFQTKNWKQIYNKVLILLIIFSSLMLYLYTLKPCSTDKEPICVRELLPQFPTFCIYISIVCLVYDTLLYLIWKRKLSAYYLIPILCCITVIITVSKGNTWQNHGDINKLYFILNLFLCIIPITICMLFYRCIKKYPLVTLAGTLGVILTYFIFLHYWMLGNDCPGWYKGLNSSTMINNGDYCELKKSDVCFFDLTNNYFDMSEIKGINSCDGRYGSEDLTRPFFNDSKLIGFPSTQWFTKGERSMHNFQKNVLRNVTLFNSSDAASKKNFEIILDKTGEHPKFDLNVHRNETTVQRSIRNEAARTHQPLTKNVLVIFIDSISRVHFKRKLPKTLGWIEQFYQNKSSSHESYQFFRYHSVGGFTDPNMFQMYYGTTLNFTTSNATSNGTQANEYFKQQGFVTASARDMCDGSKFDYTEKEFSELNFAPYDHELSGLFCDPNYTPLEEPYGVNAGPYSSFRRCFYGREAHEYLFEYGQKFWEAYSDRPKFLDINFLDAHEPTAEVVKFIDGNLVTFLEGMHAKSQLEDTTIMFYSDHGHHVSVFYNLFQLQDIYVELRLPVLYILLPRDVADTNGTQLAKNEQSLIGGYDIFNFWQVLSGAQSYHKGGRNIFESIPANRSCSEFYFADVKCIFDPCEHEAHSLRRN
jgi:hypothetical protein